LPSIDFSSWWSEGAGNFCSALWIDITKPGVQKPLWCD
jgi:hypothetical protein